MFLIFFLHKCVYIYYYYEEKSRYNCFYGTFVSFIFFLEKGKPLKEQHGIPISSTKNKKPDHRRFLSHFLNQTSVTREEAIRI